MDLSTFALPLRKDRRSGAAPLFQAPSVNVNYETVEGEQSSPSQKSRSGEMSEMDTSISEAGGKEAGLKEENYKEAIAPSGTAGGAAGSAPSGTSGGPVGGSHQMPFPLKSPLRSPLKSPSIASDNSRARSASRSSFSLASAECQQFVASLKEPRYAKPLTGDEIGWIFQDFYLKLRQDLLAEGPEVELQTPEEQESRAYIASNIESILDRAEKVITGGELHAKLFALEAAHDELLQPRIDLIRKYAMAEIARELGVESSKCPQTAVQYINRMAREVCPKGKLTALIKAHRAIADESEGNSADTVFPLFVYCLLSSELTQWWQNFTFIKRLRRASELTGQSSYCLTNFEAAIHFIEQFTFKSPLPELQQLQQPLSNPRSPRPRPRGGGSFSQRISDTLQTYRASWTRRPHIEQRFLEMEADQLTLSDVKQLLNEYKRLAASVGAGQPSGQAKHPGGASGEEPPLR